MILNEFQDVASFIYGQINELIVYIRAYYY